MEGTRFDSLVRALGADGTRRGFVGLLAALAAGGTVADAGAKRKCRRDSPAGQCCRKDGACTCKDGGTVCGTNCCRIGQTCVDGICSAMPEPPVCLTYGQPCKNAGVPCCEGMTCGSGQGGGAVACWVRKTGRCDSTSECIFGTECVDGICIAPVPPPPGPTCNVQLGEQCGAGDVCCTGTCDGLGDLSIGQPRGQITCCAAEGESCTEENSQAQCCGSFVCGDVNGTLKCVD